MRIEMDEQEWRNVLACLAQAPWNVANPLIMKIGEQMRLQSPAAGAGMLHGRPNGPDEASDGLQPGNTAQRAS